MPRWSTLWPPENVSLLLGSMPLTYFFFYPILLQLHVASSNLVVNPKHLLWKPGGGPLVQSKPTHPRWRHILKSSMAFAHFLDAINALPLKSFAITSNIEWNTCRRILVQWSPSVSWAQRWWAPSEKTSHWQPAPGSSRHERRCQGPELNKVRSPLVPFERPLTFRQHPELVCQTYGNIACCYVVPER